HAKCAGFTASVSDAISRRSASPPLKQIFVSPLASGTSEIDIS
ncbi:uncharacterized protein LOC123257060, partial [Drosophila ananassae]